MEDPLPDPTNIWVSIIALLALIFFNALLVMGETAIVALNDSKVRKSAEEGDKKAARVLKLLESPTSFLSAVQIGTTFLGFLAVSFAAISFSGYLAFFAAISSKLSYYSYFYIAAVVIVALVFSFIFLLLGNLVPKQIALHKGEKVAFRLAGFLLFIRALSKPFAFLLLAFSNLTLRVLGIDPNANQELITEEEILMMVDEGEEKGVIEESQKEMINNIFEFDDITAGSVMTHRTDIVAVEIGDTLDDVLKAAINEGYSRIPVYEDDLDNIKGILYVKDLLPLVGRQIYDRTIRSIMREVRFVPESKRCGDLFTEMTESRIQMVIVSDEYGGVAGLLTMEDLLESIVGNIRDEYDQDEEEEVKRVDETTITVDGTTDISDIEEELEVDLPDGDYDTIGGFIMSELGRIPKEGENPVIESTGFKFTVVEVDERRIERIKIEKLETEDSTDAENE